VIAWTYEGQFPRIREFLRAWLGPDFTISVHPHAGLFPTTITLVNPNWSIAISAGTEDWQSLALQAWYAKTRPVNFGIFSTNVVWYGAALRLSQVLVADGADPTKPVLVTGHSFGGALSILAAAIFKTAIPSRRVSLLTFAAPKAGDIRVAERLNGVKEVHIVNNDDIVPILPPSDTDLLAMVPFFGPTIATLWGTWLHPSPMLVLDPSGTVRVGSPDYPGTDVIRNLITNNLAGFVLGPIRPHRAAEYALRLNRRCPEIAWPWKDDANRWFGIADEFVLRLGARKKPLQTLALIARPKDLADGVEVLGGTHEPADGVEVLGGTHEPADGVEVLGGTHEPADGVEVLGGTHEPADGVEVLGGFHTRLDGSLAVGGTHEPADGLLGMTTPTAPPAPGPDCSTAMDLALGVTWNGTTSTSAQQWFRIAITGGTQYHARISAANPPFVSAGADSGSSCSGLTFRFFIDSSLGPCNTYTPGSSEYLYVHVSQSFMTENAYTLIVDTGGC
jgi:hypothetical protein